MSKLMINKFINKNKIRLMSLGTIVIMSFSLPSCTYSRINTSNVSKSDSLDENQKGLKSYIIDNITNMEIIKSEEAYGYWVFEDIYSEEPIYNTNGEVKYYDKIYVGTYRIFVTFEEAELLELTEILEARVVWSQNVK